MNASERNQKRIRKTRAIIVLLLLSMIFPIIWLILTLPNFLRDLHLRNSGIVATGTVVSIYSIGCGSDSDSGDFSYDVQFIDNHGQTWVDNISQCNNIIGDLSVGDTIALLYAPDDPTVIAVQDRFTSQFQLDQIEAVGGVVIFIGMILAILLTLLRYLLLVLRERGPSPGNWLLALASKNEAVASFIDRKLCRIGIHQGEWTKTGCQLKRYCMFCGTPQDREEHHWPPRASGSYFQDGSCEKRVTCLDCEKTKSIGKEHEGRKSWWNSKCRRCGEVMD